MCSVIVTVTCLGRMVPNGGHPMIQKTISDFLDKQLVSLYRFIVIGDKPSKNLYLQANWLTAEVFAQGGKTAFF